MIVPVIFELSDEKVPYLWIFYKYMYFCINNNYPIIALEDYFESPKKYQELQSSIFKNVKNGYNWLWEFPEPTDKDVKKVKKVLITKEEIASIVKPHKNKFDAWVDLTKNGNKNYEKMLQSKIDEIESTYHEKIDAFLTWAWNPSMEKIAQKNEIKVINQELTTFRKNTYHQPLGYFIYGNKYDSNGPRESYKEFQESMKNERLLSRAEIIALFLSKDSLSLLKKMNQKPSYEFGIDLGLDRDVFIDAYTKVTNKELITQCIKLVGKDNIICRTHPMRPSKDKFDNMDHSPTSLDWILKCNRIITTLSNMSFEAMLFKRTSYILEENIPFYIEAVNSLNRLEDKLASISFINYITFAYYVPYELLFDKEYILWRTKENPTIKEIYNYNLKYILNKFNIDKHLLSMNYEERLLEILKKVHGFDIKDARSFLKEIKQNDIEVLENEIISLKNEINTIRNSKGWKLLEKLRKLKP